MSFFKKMERRFGRYAIHNLMYYIIILYGAGLVINLLNPYFYWNYLSLNIGSVLHGQIWRLVTFLIYPPVTVSSFRDIFGLFFCVIALLCYYSLGNTLEAVWGAFKFNVYFLMGIVGHILAAVVVYAMFKINLPLTTTFLNFSVFMAFAISFPETQFYLMMAIPVKAKYLAIAEGVYYFYLFISGGILMRVEIGMSLLNLLLFILMTQDYGKFNPKTLKKRREFQKNVRIMPKNTTHHKCAVCGRTELDDPNLEFRYCSKCEGDYEYCQDHLYTHQHVQSGHHS